MAEPVARAEAPYMPEVAAWIRENLPPATPSRLLHGDLLGQNVLCRPDGRSIGVIDWEAARLGDPAYDLAIITRGRRKPFGYTDGLFRLLDAYNERALAPLGPAMCGFMSCR
jgi:aminoglycoside phosphotransferase (APT) family kinase protein